MYEYKAYVRKVYDGDTITVDIDLGFGVVLKNHDLGYGDGQFATVPIVSF